MSAISQVFNGQNILASALQASLPVGVQVSDQAIGIVKYVERTSTVDQTDIFDAGLHVSEDGHRQLERIEPPSEGWWQLRAIQFTANRVGGLLNIDSAIRFKVFGWRRSQFEFLLNATPLPAQLPSLFDGSINEYDDDADPANDRWLNSGEDTWAYWELDAAPRLFNLPGVDPGPRCKLQGNFFFPPYLVSYMPNPQAPYVPQSGAKGMYSYFSLHAVMPVRVSQVRLIFIFDRPSRSPGG